MFQDTRNVGECSREALSLRGISSDFITVRVTRPSFLRTFSSVVLKSTRSSSEEVTLRRLLPVILSVSVPVPFSLPHKKENRTFYNNTLKTLVTPLEGFRKTTSTVFLFLLCTDNCYMSDTRPVTWSKVRLE